MGIETEAEIEMEKVMSRTYSKSYAMPRPDESLMACALPRDVIVREYSIQHGCSLELAREVIDIYIESRPGSDWR